MSALSSPAATWPQRRSFSLKQALAHPLANYYLVLGAGAALVILGVFMVASAASVFSQVSAGDPYYYGKRHLVFALVGVLAAYLMSRLPHKVLRGLAWPAIILALFFVGLTYTSLAQNINGNQNWLRFGPSWTQFQPSEFAKVALVLWGAQHLEKKEKLLKDMRQWFSFIIISVLLIGLVLIHDLGSAAVMTLMFVATLFLAGAPVRLLAVIGAGGAAGILALVKLEGNRMARIMAWLNPDQYSLDFNFQANHGLYGLASGGFWGLGLGASRQKWGGLMSTGYTDYIMAIVGEELGLFGTLMVIALFVVLTFAGVRVASRAASSFGRLVAIGVTSWFVLQAIVNIAVVFRWLPVLGVTLPFVSYGGSSLIATLLGLGLLLGCARQEPEAAKLLGTPKSGPGKVTQVFTRSAP